MRNRLWAMSLLACVVSTIVACREDLNGTAGCPALCPEQNIVSRDTVLDAFLTVDTTVTGYPVLGTESFLLLASRGDTLDARAVMRFDTLTQKFTRGGTDSTIYAVDSSMVIVRLDTTGTKATAPVTVEIYDVDTTAVDTATSAALALFRPDRLIGGKTYEVTELKDTLRIPLLNDKVLAKLTGAAPKRLRIGFKVSSTKSAQIRLVAREGGVNSQLSYDPSPDTVVKALVNTEASLTPTDNPTLRGDLTDYQLVAKGQGAGGATSFLGVGGLPAQRAYFKFNVPTRLVDSTTIVRATLLLTQVATNSVDAGDSITIYPQVVRAALELQDVIRAAGILNPPGLEIDSLKLKPNASGQRAIEMVGALRAWQAVGATTLQRAIVLRSAREGAEAPSVLFYSSEAAPSQRPRLRITYVNKVEFGVP
ncbi:MAG TPA: hypothetical protein VM076_07700 [Gemmatimonadaceae bacterium]|nr:hypothetical protein [Gemmatimonadaceae bacterium]